MKTPEQFAASREYAAAALAKLNAGEPLDKCDSQAVARIVQDTLAGRDPREDLGIQPKGGRPKAAHHFFIAVDYLSLLAIEPLEKQAASKVAERWGIARLATVREIAAEKRDKAQLLLEALTAEEIAEMSSLYAAVNR